MEKHKYNIFPEIIGSDLELLKGDIKNNGYDSRYPIYTFEGKILDGWNRYKICEELGVDPTYKEFEGSEMEALEFVMRTNKRRNLTSSQWAVIAIDSEEIVEAIKKQAKERETLGKKLPTVETGRTSEVMAEMFNTNNRYIKEVAKIKKENPADLDLIRSGSKTISEYKKEEKTKQRIKDIEERFAKQQDDIDDREITPYGENIYYLSTKFQDFPSSYKIIEDGDHFPTLKRRSWFYHPDGREFSLREYAEVQTFPNEFKFVGTYEKIKDQIGNAVAPDMAKHIGKKLKGKTLGDLFAGCGGLSYGLGYLGIEAKWAIERNIDYARTYKINHPNTSVYTRDVKVFDPSNLEEVDIIVGGPPCQGFSLSGKRFKDDPRNELYKEFVRYVEALSPNEFVMENVPQIREIEDQVIEDFEKLGYEVEGLLVKGEEIGMRQHRNRYFFIGVKNGNN